MDQRQRRLCSYSESFLLIFHIFEGQCCSADKARGHQQYVALQRGVKTISCFELQKSIAMRLPFLIVSFSLGWGLASSMVLRAIPDTEVVIPDPSSINNRRAIPDIAVIISDPSSINSRRAVPGIDRSLEGSASIQKRAVA